MPSALAFDTHAYVRRLRDVGVPEEQAEVQVEAIASILHDRMVTKEDHRRDIKELETELKRDNKELENRLLVRIGTLVVVGIGLIATLVKLL